MTDANTNNTSLETNAYNRAVDALDNVGDLGLSAGQKPSLESRITALETAFKDVITRLEDTIDAHNALANLLLGTQQEMKAWLSAIPWVLNKVLPKEFTDANGAALDIYSWFAKDVLQPAFDKAQAEANTVVYNVKNVAGEVVQEVKKVL